MIFYASIERAIVEMLKEELRKRALLALKTQNEEEKQQRDRQLLEQFCATKAYRDSQVIATYLAFPFEFDTTLIINQAKRDGKKIVVPKTFAGGKMIFVLYNPDDLVKTSFGLWEPSSSVEVLSHQIDLIHVPGLAFRLDGYRIGFGAGYYDRYLADFSKETISLVYPFQLIDFKVSSHDIAVKEVLL